MIYRGENLISGDDYPSTRLLVGSSQPSLPDYSAAPVNFQQHQGFSPEEIIRIILKWRTLIIIFLIVGPLAGFLLALLTTPKYRASATIQINYDQPSAVTVGQNLQPAINNNSKFFATQYGLLQSEALAGRVVDVLRLADNPAFANQGAPIHTKRANAIAVIRGGLKIQPLEGSELVNIVFENENPVTASKIADSFANEFIASNIERRFDATSYARKFLQQRLASTKTKLEQSERELVQYAASQGIIDLNTSSGTNGGNGGQSSLDADSLVAVNAALIQAHTDRIAAQARYQQASHNGATLDTIQNATVQTLEAQLAELQAEYQDKLSTFLPQLPSMLAMKARIDQLRREIKSAKSNVNSAVRSEYEAAIQRENTLQARVAELRASVLNLRDRSINYTILQREVDTNRALYDALLQRFKEVGVAAGVGENLVSVIDRAKVPDHPFSPKISLNIALGLFFGAIIGFGLAFAIEFIDDTIKSAEDVENKLGLTALGVVPIGMAGESIDMLLADPRSEVTEAYSSISTALRFATGHGVPKTILISSSRSGEGKSSAVLALAISFARLNKRVLVIDADLRKPAFAVPKRVREGLTNLLAGADNISESVLETEIPNIFLLPSGPRVPNPAELLGTTRFRAVLEEVSGYFDLVIVDGPPVLGLADAPLLGSVCEAAIFIIEASGVRRLIAANAISRLRASNTRFLGAVLNKYDFKRTGYGYGYGYGYGAYTYGNETEEALTSKRQIELLK